MNDSWKCMQNKIVMNVIHNVFSPFENRRIKFAMSFYDISWITYVWRKKSYSLT